MRVSELVGWFGVATIAAALLAGCGQNGGDSYSDSDAESTETFEGTASSTLSAAAAAEEALQTYLQGLIDGDLDVSYAVCDPDSAGGTKLAAYIQKRNKDWGAAMDGKQVTMLTKMVTQNADKITYALLNESDDEVVYELTLADGNTQNATVVYDGGAWRVQPPGNYGIASIVEDKKK